MENEKESLVGELTRALDDRYVRREQHSKTEARVTNLEAELADLRRLVRDMSIPGRGHQEQP
jgi:phosphoketolase